MNNSSPKKVPNTMKFGDQSFVGGRRGEKQGRGWERGKVKWETGLFLKGDGTAFALLSAFRCMIPRLKFIFAVSPASYNARRNILWCQKEHQSRGRRRDVQKLHKRRSPILQNERSQRIAAISVVTLLAIGCTQGNQNRVVWSFFVDCVFFPPSAVH